MKVLHNKRFKNILKTVAVFVCLALLLNVFSCIFKFNSGESVFAVSTAQEEPIKPLDYTIKLDYQGGVREETKTFVDTNGHEVIETIKKENDSLKINSNRKVSVAVPNKEGYVFAGFFDENDNKYFDDRGQLVEGIVFTPDTPRLLKANWIKLHSIKVQFVDSRLSILGGKYNYSEYKAFELDIDKLKELRYSKVQVNFAIKSDIHRCEKLRLKIDLVNPTFENVWFSNEIFAERLKDGYAYFSTTIDMSKLSSQSQMRFGFKIIGPELLSNWTIQDCFAYFSAVMQQPKNPLAKDVRVLSTNSYVVENDTGYNINTAAKGRLFDKTYTELSLRYTGGKLLNGDNNSYGYIADNEFDGEEAPNLGIYLKYNYPTSQNIANTDWNISNDTWKSDVNGISGVGAVQTGALLVQKSYDGVNWIWDNTMNNSTTDSFHTVDFVNNYKPETYNGQAKKVSQYSATYQRNDNGVVYKYDDKGKITGVEFLKDENGNYVTEETYVDTDGYLQVYRPNGNDLGKGIYIRVLFAYELSYYTYNNGWEETWDNIFRDTKVWHYKNVVEETTIYLANSSANIIFQNMDFSQSSAEHTSANDSNSKLIRQFGAVKSGHAVNDGFRVNFNGNSTFKVRYRKNNSQLNDEVCDAVYDGRVFLEPGKYEFIVYPKIGNEKHYTIYINERGLQQNFYRYFKDSLITSDSTRIYSVDSSVPVYLAGEVSLSSRVAPDAENFQPIVGKVGLYQESLTAQELNQKYYVSSPQEPAKILNTNAMTYSLRTGGEEKYFVVSARVEVDENYTLIPDDGFMSYRDYVTAEYESTGMDGYELLDEPFQKNGKTYVASIYTYRMDGNRKIVGTIDGYDVYKIVATKTNDSVAPFESSKLTEEGYYVGIFANNKDYFNNVELSGDIYKFVFQFMVSKDKKAPSINQALIGKNLSISDYQSKFYGVTIPTAGTGNAVFVFYNFEEAYDTAYEYARSKVEIADGKYIFNSQAYTNQKEVLSKVQEYALSIISTKYFDMSNPASYLTYYGAITNFDDLKLKQDVFVVSNSQANYNNICGLPFLNNKVNYYLENLDGEPKTSINSTKFIQIANYETSTISLKHLESGLEYHDLPYGVDVQEYLEGKNAPSGEYQITETNSTGKVEYNAIYIKKGDNRTTLEVKRVNATGAISQTISAEYANTTFVVNSFIISSAENDLDPYGIVKIRNEKGEEEIYQLDEVDEIILDTQGEWTIIMVDRLGNSYQIKVVIYNPSQIHKLTLMDGENEYDELFVAGGERVYLDNLTTTNENMEFIGWQDEKGKIYTNSMVFAFDKDTVLTALWSPKQTSLYIYDGVQIEKRLVKGGNKVVLPNLTKTGFELYGYKYTVNNSDRFCIGQLNSVPYQENVRLDAVWMDTTASITLSHNDVLPQAPSKNGMKFYAWATKERGANAVILKGSVVDVETSAPLTLYALYTTDESATNEIVPIVSSGSSSGLQQLLNNSAFTVPTSTLFIGMLCMLLFVLGKKKTQKSFSSVANKTEKVKNVKVSKQEMIFAAEETSATKSFEIHTKKFTRKDNSYKIKRNLKIKNLLIPIVSMCMALVFVFTFSYKTIISVCNGCRLHQQQVEIQRIIDDYTEKVLEANTPAVVRVDKETLLNSYNKDDAKTESEQKISQTADVGTIVETGEDKSLQLLYGCIQIDLLDKGYLDVFGAELVKDDIHIEGIAYTLYDGQQSENGIYDAGFISKLGQQDFNAQEFEGCSIEKLVSDNNKEKFIYNTEYLVNMATQHYVAFNQYCQYSVEGNKITYSSQEDNEELYNQELGFLYNYDLDKIVFDPNLGKKFDTNGFSTSSPFDYDEAYDLFKSQIREQDNNLYTVETVNVLMISVDALKDYLLHDQDETYLGVSADELYYYESQVDATQYYYIDGQTGAVSVLNLPNDENGSLWWRIALAVITMGAGVVMLCIPGMQAFGALTLASGGAQLADSLGAHGFAKILNFATTIATCVVTGNVLPLVLYGLSEKGGGHLAGAYGYGASGLGSIKLGFNMMNNGPFGKVLGIINIVIGAVDLGFAANELAWEFTGKNYIQELTGMSDELYYALGATAMTATTVMLVSSSMYGAHAIKQQQIKAYKAKLESAEKAQKELYNLQKEFEGKKYISTEEVVRQLPGDKNNKFKLYDDNNMPVKTADKANFAKNGGNGYLVSTDYPNLKIPVKNGYPQFENINSADPTLMIGKVYLEGGITTSRSKNFKLMDAEFADVIRKNANNPEFNEVKNLLVKKCGVKEDLSNLNAKHISKLRTGKIGGYTWHESEDLHTAYLVKTEFHNALSHSGGRALIAAMVKQNYNSILSSYKQYYNEINYFNKYGGKI